MVGAGFQASDGSVRGAQVTLLGGIRCADQFPRKQPELDALVPAQETRMRDGSTSGLQFAELGAEDLAVPEDSLKTAWKLSDQFGSEQRISS